MVYHLHITNKNYSSWSLRPWVLMRALSIPFTEHMHELHELVPGSYAQPQWSAFSPVAHVPCLHDVSSSPSSETETETETLILWDSLAIIEHLSETHPQLAIYPRSPPARAWARSATAEMHSSFAALRSEMSMNIGLRISLTGRGGPSAALEADLARLDALWREGLRRFGGPFLAGPDFGAVDAFYAPVALRVQTFVGAEEALGEEARAYVHRVVRVPAVREWVEAALAETARDRLHDEDSIAGRRVIADLRAVA
ncbi:hypothetical protein B0T22DRAFT_464303 [Podospora appendiculata]|uniref:GST N-terminal domain-containing protein n=1 Tax=Podospora appendiculata TaxID=314037 RepID=A0AAE0X4I1_9PEZI|nr:hypothetical protein B0T22DRAFT_464303 [Podospora appendiculata]